MVPREKKERRSVNRSAPQGHRPQGGEVTPRRGLPLHFYTHNINTRPAFLCPTDQISSSPSTTQAWESVHARNASDVSSSVAVLSALAGFVP